MIYVAETNKNDIIKLLGPPSVKSTFNNDLYFYIERKTTTGKLIKLGKKKFLENNVLVLEIDNRGILAKKEFYDLNNMKKIKIVSNETSVDYKKQSFIYDVYSFMQKLVDQLNEVNKKDKVEDNLFVKNIIVNKDKFKKQVLPFVPTEKWIGQLGNRLEINY